MIGMVRLSQLSNAKGIGRHGNVSPLSCSTNQASFPVIASIITAWGRLALIDPANGAVTPADRVEARLAAADIKAQLRAMEVLSRDANAVLAKMGIIARNQNEPTFGPAQTCAAIWNSGRLDPPLVMR